MNISEYLIIYDFSVNIRIPAHGKVSGYQYTRILSLFSKVEQEKQ